MKLQRSGNNLVLSVNDTDDMLTVQIGFITNPANARSSASSLPTELCGM